jgi:hypothetical protein
VLPFRHGICLSSFGVPVSVPVLACAGFVFPHTKEGVHAAMTNHFGLAKGVTVRGSTGQKKSFSAVFPI